LAEQVGEGARQTEDDDLLALGEIRHLEGVRAHGTARGFLLDELRERAIRHAVTNFDRHECLLLRGWFERGVLRPRDSASGG